MKKKINIIMILLFMISVVASAQNKSSTITLTSGTLPDGVHAYYHEILKESLEQNGYTLDLKVINVPQTRAESMLDSGGISIYWFIKTAERDARWVPVNCGLTNGLIGQRVLFIPKGKQQLYSQVRTLNDFRNLKLTAGFGKNWYDVKVWEVNNLSARTVDGDWHVLYTMVAQGNRQIDYFSRGFNEIIAESKQHPELDIEKHILLTYDRDFIFYMNKKDGTLYKNIIEQSLLKAKESGLVDRIICRYFAENFKVLMYDSRIKIKLRSPD